MLNDLLSRSEVVALRELIERLRLHYKVEKVVVFGSKVRGEADDESDLDVLILTGEKATYELLNEVSGECFEVNLKHGTNISVVVIDKASWETGLWSVTPFHDAVQNEGVTVYEQ